MLPNIFKLHKNQPTTIGDLAIKEKIEITEGDITVTDNGGGTFRCDFTGNLIDTYMIRAVKLEITGSGSFYNSSTGIIY